MLYSPASFWIMKAIADYEGKPPEQREQECCEEGSKHITPWSYEVWDQAHFVLHASFAI